MIVVDTSALMAIVQNETEADRCHTVLSEEELILISASTLAETLIVAARRRVLDEMDVLLDSIAPTVVPVTEATARAATSAYSRWGKGQHRSDLNFADCFALCAREGKRVWTALCRQRLHPYRHLSGRPTSTRI